MSKKRIQEWPECCKTCIWYLTAMEGHCCSLSKNHSKVVQADGWCNRYLSENWDWA